MNGGKEFLVFDIEGKFIKTTCSQSAFADEIGSCVQSVNNVLRGIKNKHSVKRKILIFKDEFTEEKLNEILARINNIHREFVVFDKNNIFLGKFNNQIRCNEEIKISTRSIQNQLKNNKIRDNSRKYKVYYLEDIPEELKDRFVKKEG